MLILIGKIAVYLIIAALQGVIIGWLIARHLYLQKAAETKSQFEEDFQHQELETEILQNAFNKKVAEISVLQQKLEECERKYRKLKVG